MVGEGVERGGIIYRTGGVGVGTRTTNFLKSSENFVLIFLVDTELPGMSFVFLLQEKMSKPKNNTAQLPGRGFHDINPNITLFNSPIKHWKKDYQC